MGGLAPANTLVPSRVIAREAVSRLFISSSVGRIQSRFHCRILKVGNGQHWKARSVASFDGPATPVALISFCPGGFLALEKLIHGKFAGTG